MRLLRTRLSALLVLAVPPAAAVAEVPPGPCASPTLAAITDRPAIGRPAPTSGAVCVAAPGEIVVELGYRNQTTTSDGGTQHLVVVPNDVILVGMRNRTNSSSQAASLRRGEAAIPFSFQASPAVRIPRSVYNTCFAIARGHSRVSRC